MKAEVSSALKDIFYSFNVQADRPQNDYKYSINKLLQESNSTNCMAAMQDATSNLTNVSA